MCGYRWCVLICTGGLSQDQRLEAMSKLKQYQCRVLISTDLVRERLCCYYFYFFYFYFYFVFTRRDSDLLYFINHSLI